MESLVSSPALSTELSTAPTSLWQIFWGFTLMSMQGFGGLLAVAQRVVVDERRWLTRQQFVETFALAQAMPGANMCNLAILLGDEFLRLRGAVAALAGLLIVPMIIVILLTISYTLFADNAMVAGALRGMGAVSAGMIAGAALRLAGALQNNRMGWLACSIIAGAGFVMVALLRWPLAWVILGLGGAACVYAARVIVKNRLKISVEG